MWTPFQEPLPGPKPVSEWTPPPPEEEPAGSSSPTTPPLKGPCAVCGSLSKSPCPGCSAVFYCSKKHQATDWGRHKGVCRPFCLPMATPPSGKVTPTSDAKPRWMTATRDIPPGFTLLSEKPWLVTPNPNVSGASAVCLGCCRVGSVETLAMAPCSRCLLPLCPHCIRGGHLGEECVAIGAAVAKNRGLMEQRTFDPDLWPDLTRDLSILKVFLALTSAGGKGPHLFLGLRSNPRYQAQLRDPSDEVKIWLGTEYSLSDLFFRSPNFAKSSPGVKFDEVIRLWATFSDVPPHNGALRVLYLNKSWIGHSCSPTAELLFHGSDPSLSIHLKTVESLKGDALICANFLDPAYSGGVSKSTIRLWEVSRLTCSDKGCACRTLTRVDASVGVRCSQIPSGTFSLIPCPGYLAPTLDPPNPDKGSLGLLIYNKSKPWSCTRCRRCEKYGAISRPLRNLIDRMRTLISPYLRAPDLSTYPGLATQLHGALSESHWLWVDFNTATLVALDLSGGQGKELLARFVRLSPQERVKFLGLLSLKGELYGDGLYPNLVKGQSQGSPVTAKGLLTLEGARWGRYSTRRGPLLLDAFFTNLILFGEEWKSKVTSALGTSGGQPPLQSLASESVAKWRQLLKLAQDASLALRDPAFSSPERRRLSETASELASILQGVVSSSATGRDAKVSWVIEVMSRFISRLYPCDTLLCTKLLPQLTSQGSGPKGDLLQTMFDPEGSRSSGILTFGPAYGDRVRDNGSGDAGASTPLPTAAQLREKWRQSSGAHAQEDSSHTETEEESTSESSSDFDLNFDLDLDGDEDDLSAPLEYYQQLLNSTLRQRLATEKLLERLLR